MVRPVGCGESGLAFFGHRMQFRAVTLRQKLKSTIRALLRGAVFPGRGKRENPDEGAQGAGVPAGLKPTPPVLAAAAARSLPGPGEQAA